ncbi:MAG: ACP S-malonyltransferase [Candidatus Limnocylindria bacterium]
MTRAAVAFPSRGSYGPASLGSLPPNHPWVRRADELRAADGLTLLSELDGAERFDAAIHLRSANAAPLTFLCGLLDAERIADDHEVVVVIASSTGWYTALAASGALPFDDAFRLVQTMALLAEDPIVDDDPGGQLVYALADDDWQPDAMRISALEAVLDHHADVAHLSIDLGAFSTVSAPTAMLRTIATELPKVRSGSRRFPLRAGGQQAWHTPLRAQSAAEAEVRLQDLAWATPNVTLVDGRGVRFTPWSTDAATLGRHTIGDQPKSTYDFAASFQVALREYAPDVILLPGPGATLGEACAQSIVREGYRGIRIRSELEELQGGTEPILLSMRR